MYLYVSLGQGLQEKVTNQMRGEENTTGMVTMPYSTKLWREKTLAIGRDKAHSVLELTRSYNFLVDWQ